MQPGVESWMNSMHLVQTKLEAWKPKVPTLKGPKSAALIFSDFCRRLIEVGALPVSMRGCVLPARFGGFAISDELVDCVVWHMLSDEVTLRLLALMACHGGIR